MRYILHITIVLMTISCVTSKSQGTRTQPDFGYSFDSDLADRSAQYLAYGQNAEVCPELSAKARTILGYWITRGFKNTLNWQVTHNGGKGAFAFISGDELELVKHVSIMNPMAVIENCSYTHPTDSIGFILEFANRYEKIGVGYAHITYDTPTNDSLLLFGDAWELDVVLVLVE